MAKRSRFDELDQAVAAILARPAAPLPRAEAALAPLVGVAAELRGLPRENFKARLKTDLQRRAEMATQAVAVPKPAFAVTPYLCVSDAAAAIEFYKKAFGAVEVGRLPLPNGKIVHAQIEIGGAIVMLADELSEYGFHSPQSLGGSSIKVYLHCDDVDALVQRAVAAGATLVRPVKDEFYGQRSGNVRDPFGYTWVVATQKEVLTTEEIQQRFKKLQQAPASPAAKPVREGFHTVTPYLVAERPEPFLEFIKQAFGAEEVSRAPGSAGGTHVELRIGDSMVMAGGAPGYPGTPSAIHLYVTDADAVYQRALAAGATSIYAPMDQPYGDREGGVKDGFGNNWYIATHKATGHRPEGMRTVTPTLHPRGADSLLDFMKRAFAAEEEICERSPDGTVLHASVRIGDSVVEIGEARGPIEPTAAMMLLYVADVDAAYQRAVAAGAASIETPADQPYGERRAGVKDPHGNKWYFSAPVARVAK